MNFTKLKYLFLAFLFFVFLSERSLASAPAYSNTNPEDSLKRVINREARKASLMSMVLPGLGQAYNKKYWKIPIIYAALGGIGYFAMVKNQQYQDFHNELLYRYSHNDTMKNDPSFAKFTSDQINTQKIQAKKYRDFCIIGMGLVYLINIIDANVGAHLKTFDVSDNLSLSIKPKAFYCSKSPYGLAGGVSIALNFK